MALKIGGSKIKDLRIGNKKVLKVLVGSKQVWPEPSIPSENPEDISVPGVQMPADTDISYLTNCGDTVIAIAGYANSYIIANYSKPNVDTVEGRIITPKYSSLFKDYTLRLHSTNGGLVAGKSFKYNNVLYMCITSTGYLKVYDIASETITELDSNADVGIQSPVIMYNNRVYGLVAISKNASAYRSNQAIAEINIDSTGKASVGNTLVTMDKPMKGIACNGNSIYAYSTNGTLYSVDVNTGATTSIYTIPYATTGSDASCEIGRVTGSNYDILIIMNFASYNIISSEGTGIARLGGYDLQNKTAVSTNQNGGITNIGMIYPTMIQDEYMIFDARGADDTYQGYAFAYNNGSMELDSRTTAGSYCYSQPLNYDGHVACLCRSKSDYSDVYITHVGPPRTSTLPDVSLDLPDTDHGRIWSVAEHNQIMVILTDKYLYYGNPTKGFTKIVHGFKQPSTALSANPSPHFYTAGLWLNGYYYLLYYNKLVLFT